MKKTLARHQAMLTLSGLLWLSSVTCVHAHDAPFIRSLRTQGDTTFLATNRGLMHVHAQTGHLICHEALGTRSSEALRFTIAKAGALLVATSRGLLRDESGGCGLSREASALLGTAVQDIATEKGKPDRHWLVTAAQDEPNGLFVSNDDGQTFEAFSDLARDTFFNALRVSDDGTSVFRSGMTWDPESGRVTHFIDKVLTEGGTSSRTEIQLDDREREARLLALGDADGKRVVVAVQARNDAQESRLMVSDDHGHSFAELGRRLGPKGAAFDATGALYVAAQDGLWRADVGSIELTKIDFDHTPSCVDASGDALHVCDSLGLTQHDGQTFGRVFRFDQIAGPMPCADDSVLAVCGDAWRDYADEILAESPADDAEPEHAEPPGTPNNPAADAPDSRSKSSGCSLREGRHEAANAVCALLHTACLILLRRKRAAKLLDFFSSVRPRPSSLTAKTTHAYRP